MVQSWRQEKHGSLKIFLNSILKTQNFSIFIALDFCDECTRAGVAALFVLCVQQNLVH